MARQRGLAEQPKSTTRFLDHGFRLVVVLSLFCVTLVGVDLLRGGFAAEQRAPSPSPSASPPVSDPATFLVASRAAPAIELEDPSGASVSLASMRGTMALVFFGYTHCPDVCPATIGIIGQALRAYGPGARALFVTVDPERDTTSWLTEYATYLPAGITPLTGSSSQIRATADAWGVKYARVDTGTAGDYAMSHTADTFVVDTQGQVRATIPFGTEEDAVAAVLRLVAATSTAGGGTGALGSSAPTGGSALALRPLVLSTSIWAREPSPVVLSIAGPGGRLNDTSLRPAVQLTAADGTTVGAPVDATPVQTPGVDDVVYVASLTIPSAGQWGLSVSVAPAGTTLRGSTSVTVVDPGGTPPIGQPAPSVVTPTVEPSQSNVRSVTTDPIPDLRLYASSTDQLLAQHRPFVLVIDSYRFRVTSACGRALKMARYFVDRWPAVAFVHVEPFAYTVTADTPVLIGTLAAPTLTGPAAAWGIGAPPWTPQAMPWIFVVDGTGIIRAKYQGVVGTDEVDTIIAMALQGQS